MRRVLAVLPILIATPAFAQQTPADEPPAIVVTGTPLDQSAKALKDCIARHCPPKEDIDASLAHAENQFIAGEYQFARETLAAAHNRNRRFAGEYPTEVADLSRAYGRMTNLSGYPEQGRLLQIDSLEALKAGLVTGDGRILAQRLETGDEYVRQGRLVAGEEVYRKVEKQARKAGEFNVVGMAMLRPAIVNVSLAKINTAYTSDARAAIRRVLATREPQLEPHRAAARILAARLAGEGDDMAAFEKAMANLSDQRSDHAVMIYSPTLSSLEREPDLDYKISFNTAPQWMDVRFRIDANGRVQDVEELRTSNGAERYWRSLALNSITKRRYLPLILPAGSNGLVRMERFSYVFDVGDQTGSRMAVRSSQGRISSLDITADPPGKPATDKGR